MPLHRRFVASLGLLMFASGALLGLAFSGGVLWAELEAVLYASRNVGASLNTLQCPLMLAPAETGVVRAAISNPTAEQLTAFLVVEISRPGGAWTSNDQIPLAPGETQDLQWNVDASNIVFGKLILLNVYVFYQGQLPDRHGSCGILVPGVPSLPGRQVLNSVLALSWAGLLGGAALWLYALRPLHGPLLELTRTCGVLGGFVSLSMLAALPRWWGLVLLLIAIAGLLVPVILTEFVAAPSPPDRRA